LHERIKQTERNTQHLLEIKPRGFQGVKKHQKAISRIPFPPEEDTPSKCYRKQQCLRPPVLPAAENF